MTRTLNGRQVLYWLFGTFGVIVAVNALFITKAISTYPGEDVSSPYLQGVDYNDTLADRARQATLGWRASISAARSPDARVTVTVRFEADDVLPQSFALHGLLRHPMDAERDHPLSLVRTADGTFVGHLSGVSKGAWDVVVSTDPRAATPFEATRRVWLN